MQETEKTHCLYIVTWIFLGFTWKSDMSKLALKLVYLPASLFLEK